MDLHRLIHEVKLRPALWHYAHPDRANRVETQRQWRCISDAVGQPVELCRNKWKNLRCSYRRQVHRRESLHSSPTHQWIYAEEMNFLDSVRHRNDSSNYEDDECDQSVSESMPLQQAVDEMEADNDELMQEFQSIVTPQALLQLSHNISLASAAAEEERATSSAAAAIAAAATTTTPSSIPLAVAQGTALAAAAASSCQCARRVDEQVSFLENLEREEQQLIQSTSQDLVRCKNSLHIGDSDYNFLISFLPVMKKMDPLQNVQFRAKVGEVLLQTMQGTAVPQQQEEQQQEQQQQYEQQLPQPSQHRESPQPSVMLLNQQQMALDQAQVCSSSINWI
ncbi:CG13897 [Drosophila busckii]|uniref:CG13897 n=1 Tax=Drosophila busckii TaxID=30019 RepID=A0A0M5J7Y5_DROBS|nr:mediator of RNA polymerase II transcription subunit 15 [Drosophila busckii]ALC43286.1 CG13897 [Drosophila busckii]